MFLPYFIGGILYLNMILGSNNGFSNLTNQIQNLTTNVSTYKDEIISKIEVSHITESYISSYHQFRTLSICSTIS